MKILLITDQHFGVRNDNVAYINMYKKFYGEIVIPFIKAHNVDTIINLGDTFDKRKSVNFLSLDAAREMWFDPLREMGVQMTTLIGNHDIYYKNTLRVNAIRELLGEYENIHIVESATTINFDGTDILFLPWICDDNRDAIYREINETTARCCFGHLELNGFEAHPGAVMTFGVDRDPFLKFDKVFTGHYHMKSRQDNIVYLGNPYQLYWNDYGCKRGFHMFDTDTLKTTFYRNPFDMFHKIYYNDGCVLPDLETIKGTYVKLIVEHKSDQIDFDKTVRILQGSELADLKIIEDLGTVLEKQLEVVESEDTLTLLESYIDEMEMKQNKENIKSIMKSLYVEACSY